MPRTDVIYMCVVYRVNFLQVSFTQPKHVHGIVTQEQAYEGQPGQYKQWVSSYIVSYWDNLGYYWLDVLDASGSPLVGSK